MTRILKEKEIRCAYPPRRASSEKQEFAISFHEAYLRNQVQLAVRSKMHYNLFQTTNPYLVLGLPAAGRYLVLGTILILLS